MVIERAVFCAILACLRSPLTFSGIQRNSFFSHLLYTIPPPLPWAIVGQGEAFLLLLQEQDTNPASPKIVSTS